jgi:hypothetical protein
MDYRLLNGDASDRYEARPLLRVLECYVLWAVGELSEQALALREVTPKLQATFRREGTWFEIVQGEMNFSPEITESLQAMWQRDQQAASQAGESLDHEAWAREVVDTHFV